MSNLCRVIIWEANRKMLPQSWRESSVIHAVPIQQWMVINTHSNPIKVGPYLYILLCSRQETTTHNSKLFAFEGFKRRIVPTTHLFSWLDEVDKSKWLCRNEIGNILAESRVGVVTHFCMQVPNSQLNEEIHCMGFDRNEKRIDF